MQGFYQLKPETTAPEKHGADTWKEIPPEKLRWGAFVSSTILERIISESLPEFSEHYRSLLAFKP